MGAVNSGSGADGRLVVVGVGVDLVTAADAEMFDVLQPRFGFAGVARPESPSLCTFPITAFRVTPPIFDAI